MLFIPSVARTLFMSFSVAYTRPTFERILALIAGTILTSGRRTITGILWTLRGRVPGHPSTYHRVFSRAGLVLVAIGSCPGGRHLASHPGRRTGAGPDGREHRPTSWQVCLRQRLSS